MPGTSSINDSVRQSDHSLEYRGQNNLRRNWPGCAQGSNVTEQCWFDYQGPHHARVRHPATGPATTIQRNCQPE